MTNRKSNIQKTTWQETLASIKPRVKTIQKVEVRRKKSWRSDSFVYEVEIVKPSWETLDIRERVHFLDSFVRGV